MPWDTFGKQIDILETFTATLICVFHVLWIEQMRHKEHNFQINICTTNRTLGFCTTNRTVGLCSTNRTLGLCAHHVLELYLNIQDVMKKYTWDMLVSLWSAIVENSKLGRKYLIHTTFSIHRIFKMKCRLCESF